jgi:GT2 family glycosyltransferase
MNLKKSSKARNELISIIIVNWNGKKWLKKCLISLKLQTYKNTEIIVVDNASIDGSVEYIREKFPKVKLVLNDINVGLPKAINKGISLSKGKHLLIINNDVWVEKDFVEKLHAFYIENNFTVIAPKEKKYNKTDGYKNNTTIDPTGSPAYRPTLISDPFFLSVCYYLAKVDYVKTKGFDNDYFAYYEDVDWFWRIALLGHKISYAKNVYVYHEGAGSIGKGIKYKMFLWRNQNALQTILKNYSTFTLFIIVPVYLLQNFIEMLFFLLILKFEIVESYIAGWVFNIKNAKRINHKREWIQNNRVVSDWDILKRMYLGPAKLMMLLNYRK